MKKIILPLLLFFISVQCFSQKDTSADQRFEVVQVEAQFPGGRAGWIKYLQDSLRADLASIYLSPKKGQTIKQTAIISFMVDKEGRVSEVKIENPSEIHPALARESIRVIQAGPNWIPAMQNGRKVNFRQKQSITWASSDE